MIKILIPNEDGKIELTKEELENLLKDAETEGYMHGLKEARAELIPEQLRTSNSPNKDDFKWGNRYYKPNREERNKMFYVDYETETLPKYEGNVYEKIPYWLRHDFNPAPSCMCQSDTATSCNSNTLNSDTIGWNTSGGKSVVDNTEHKGAYNYKRWKDIDTKESNK